MQVNSAAELIKTWTRDRPDAIRAIQTKTDIRKAQQSDRRTDSSFRVFTTDAVRYRHLVIISGRYQTPDKREALGRQSKTCVVRNCRARH
jgi:hypothetical protein